MIVNVCVCSAVLFAVVQQQQQQIICCFFFCFVYIVLQGLKNTRVCVSSYYISLQKVRKVYNFAGEICRERVRFWYDTHFSGNRRGWQQILLFCRIDTTFYQILLFLDILFSGPSVKPGSVHEVLRKVCSESDYNGLVLQCSVVLEQRGQTYKRK